MNAPSDWPIRTAHVERRTNETDIAVRVTTHYIVVVCCLDNLLKGAAGVAVQNFNLMFGFPETVALLG